MCVYITDTVCVCMHKPDSDQMYMYVGTRRCYIQFSSSSSTMCLSMLGFVSKCAYIRMYCYCVTKPLPDCTGSRLSRTMGSTLSGMIRLSSSPFP